MNEHEKSWVADLPMPDEPFDQEPTDDAEQESAQGRDKVGSEPKS
jgi:hypothetical protein